MRCLQRMPVEGGARLVAEGVHAPARPERTVILPLARALGAVALQRFLVKMAAPARARRTEGGAEETGGTAVAASDSRGMGVVRALDDRTLVLRGAAGKGGSGQGAETEDPIGSRPAAEGASERGGVSRAPVPNASELELPLARGQPRLGGETRSGLGTVPPCVSLPACAS